MKITHVAIRPSVGAIQEECPVLTPELLAATGARYSRNNEGLEAILSRVEFGNKQKIDEKQSNLFGYLIADVISKEEFIAEWIELEGMRVKPELEKGVDSIFNMVDYGHASIGDMAPVAIFMDEISIFAAYYLWSICPTAGGQESSTRYIKMSAEGVVDPNVLGIPEDHRAEWSQYVAKSFQAYERALSAWEKYQNDSSENVARIPQHLLDDPSSSAQKQVARMRRNYAFDRSRYYLPVCAATNMMMVMSARSWAETISHLASHPVKELNLLADELRKALEIATPRMAKHAVRKESSVQLLSQEYFLKPFVAALPSESPEPVFFKVSEPSFGATLLFDQQENAVKYRQNRYDLVGSFFRRRNVQVGWVVSMAEIRDMNRHRTGEKFCPLASPMGFYDASDQAAGNEELLKVIQECTDSILPFAVEGGEYQADEGEPSYVYSYLLGTQFYFERNTTINKFIYEMELRTGPGTHYRYAAHYSAAIKLLSRQFPSAAKHFKEGRTEPE